MLFTKTNLRNPRGKKISISSTIWREVLKHEEKVEQAKIDGKSLRLELLGSKHLTLEKFSGNGIWYTGIDDLTPCGTIIPLSGVNFDEDEWKKLMTLKNDISESLALELTQGVKRDHSGKEINRDVLMYRWKWAMGKKKVVEGEFCLFSEEDCRIDASLNQPTGEKNTLSIEKVWGPPPSKNVDMQEVFLHLLHRKVEELVKEKCHGCQVKSDSQKDHMGLSGCINEEADHLSEFCGEAVDKILKHDLISLFEKSRRTIGANSSHSEIYAEGVMFYMTPKYALDVIHNSDDKKNKPLVILLTRC